MKHFPTDDVAVHIKTKEYSSMVANKGKEKWKDKENEEYKHFYPGFGGPNKIMRNPREKSKDEIGRAHV